MVVPVYIFNIISRSANSYQVWYWMHYIYYIVNVFILLNTMLYISSMLSSLHLSNLRESWGHPANWVFFEEHSILSTISSSLYRYDGGGLFNGRLRGSDPKARPPPQHPFSNTWLRCWGQGWKKLVDVILFVAYNSTHGDLLFGLLPHQPH